MRIPFRPGGFWSCLTLATLATLTVGCSGGGETSAPPPPDVGVAKPIQRDVTVFSEHLGSTAAYESVEVRARVTGENKAKFIVSQVLFKYTDTRIRVTGHTDSTGARDYNYGLSDRRAQSVGNYLAARGIDQNRIITQGMGPDQPVASNETDSGRAQNRRGELEIVAVES